MQQSNTERVTPRQIVPHNVSEIKAFACMCVAHTTAVDVATMIHCHHPWTFSHI
jgi:hypothetical protein